MNGRVGYVLGSTFHPAELPTVAQAVEQCGFASIWSTEDYFATGGVAGATAILGATEGIRVATGLLSAYARHPALLAMEAATIASLHPGRFAVGLGAGGLGWLDQQGIEHRRPLGVVRGTVHAVRELMRGETLTGEHGGFQFDQVRLEFPPPQPPPIHVGATGPKMTALTGEVGDGLILSVFASPEFVRLQRGILADQEIRSLPVTTFAFLQLAETAEEGRARIRPLLASALADGDNRPMTDAIGITDELQTMAKDGGAARLAAEMPDSWIDRLAVCGDAETCAARIEALLDAGSDEVALAPVESGKALLEGINRLGSVLR